MSRAKSTPKVCRLATRNTQNALINLWTSKASAWAWKTPCSAPARRIADVTSTAGVLSEGGPGDLHNRLACGT